MGWYHRLNLLLVMTSTLCEDRRERTCDNVSASAGRRTSHLNCCLARHVSDMGVIRPVDVTRSAGK